MREAVNHGGRHLVIREEAPPLRELEVRRQNEAAGLVAVGDDPEQSRRAVPVHRDMWSRGDDAEPPRGGRFSSLLSPNRTCAFQRIRLSTRGPGLSSVARRSMAKASTSAEPPSR